MHRKQLKAEREKNNWARRFAEAQVTLHALERARRAEARVAQLEKERADTAEKERIRLVTGLPDLDDVLRIQPNESIESYIARIELTLGKFDIHHDAWYRVAAQRWDISDRDMYSWIKGSPRIGAKVIS